MDFLENEISDFYTYEVAIEGQFTGFNWSPEFIMGPYRFDYLVKSRLARISHIIEVKVVADTAAVIQVLKYKDLYKSYLRNLSFPRIVIASLVAQHFTQDCLLLAKHLGIPCTLVAPINKKESRNIPLIAHNRLNYRKQNNLKPKPQDIFTQKSNWVVTHG